MKKLPKFKEIPLERIRRNRNWLSCRDGNNAVPTSQTGKTHNSQSAEYSGKSCFSKGKYNASLRFLRTYLRNCFEKQEEEEEVKRRKKKKKRRKKGV